MTIVCGTDLSSASDAACAAAAALARKAGARLVLVHAVGSPDEVPTARANLSQRAAALREVGIEVTEHVETGTSDDVVVAAAAAERATIIVLAATSRTETRPLLGRTADRITAAVEVPVLVLRDGFPVQEWIAGSRPLRITVATDLSPISDQAIAWASQLRRFGPCTFTLAHLPWQPEIFQRMDAENPLALDHTHPIVDEVVRRDVASAAAMLREAGPTDVVVQPSTDSPAHTLNRIAEERGTDVLVVGHRSVRVWRSWEGSVARAVMRSAAISVACIPDTDAVSARSMPSIRRAIAATDLSQAGNSAVLYAMSLVERGGEVTVVHVLEEAKIDSAARTRIADGLSALFIGPQLVERGVQVRVELVENEERAAAICDAADDCDADLICIASGGRSRLPRIVLGSVAQEVLLLSRRPVLLVRT
jgi:nucleotide-binding universal stress UspA family protein